MSAQQQMRAMLDELMGTQRNGIIYLSNILGENDEKIYFSDSRVCKSFLLNTCPHDILSGTRMDIGDCPRVHMLALRADYEMASAKKDYFYDIDTFEHLQAFISDCDRKTDITKRKLAETQEELELENSGKATSLTNITEKIASKISEAEDLGAKGDVENSMKLLEEVETLRKQKLDAELEFKNSLPSSSYQQQKLRVCEICSAYLGVQDNEKRLADHFGGKLHLGFIKIRQKLDELKKTHVERKAERDFSRMKRDERRKSRSRTPISRSNSTKEKEKSAHKHKHHHKHHKHHHHHHSRSKKSPTP